MAICAAARSISRSGEVMPRASSRTMSSEMTMAMGGRSHTWMPSSKPIWLTAALTPTAMMMMNANLVWIDRDPVERTDVEDAAAAAQSSRSPAPPTRSGTGSTA